jgi:hypothetical protein
MCCSNFSEEAFGHYCQEIYGRSQHIFLDFVMFFCLLAEKPHILQLFFSNL